MQPERQYPNVLLPRRQQISLPQQAADAVFKDQLFIERVVLRVGRRRTMRELVAPFPTAGTLAELLRDIALGSDAIRAGRRMN